MKIIKMLKREANKTLSNPKRVLSLFNLRAIKYYLRVIENENLVENKWVSGSNFIKRYYNSYDEYIIHQKSKLKHLSLEEYDRKYFEVLKSRLKKLDISLKDKNILCLAARIGTEVRAFRSNGAFAVGIDINPGERNEYVLYGDFHDLKFCDNSIDVVFSNSLDHAFSMDKIFSEIERVLKPGGSIIIEAIYGSSEGQSPGLYESTFWPTIDHLKIYIQTQGFILYYEDFIDYP